MENKQLCLGCKEHCSMSSSVVLTGCVYEDSSYPRNAEIWFLESDFSKDRYTKIPVDRRISVAEKIIKNQYPDAWEKEHKNIE
jgi:hypothetical protein